MCYTLTGWDMICSIVKRIVSLAAQEILSNAYKAFYNLEVLSLMVSDLFHIEKHTCKHCVLSSEERIFHPSLSKFQQIMKNPENDKNLNLSIGAKMGNMEQSKVFKISRQTEIQVALFGVSQVSQ